MSLVNELLADAGEVEKGGPGSGRKPGGGNGGKDNRFGNSRSSQNKAVRAAKASAEANRLSEVANASGKGKDHEAAEIAHSKAATLNNAYSGDPIGAAHMEAANFHSAARVAAYRAGKE